MEKKQKQTRRYSDTEFSVIKNTFADNDELLTAIRKSMLQMNMTKTDKELIKLVTGNKLVLALIRKCMLPTLDPEAPRHQLVDLWMTIKLDDKSPEQAYVYLQSRELLINYLDQQLNELEGNVLASEKIVLDNMTLLTEDTHETYANFITRNTIVGHVETQLSTLLTLAGEKEETVLQTQERLNRNSAK